jgi:hypothetical protein
MRERITSHISVLLHTPSFRTNRPAQPEWGTLGKPSPQTYQLAPQPAPGLGCGLGCGGSRVGAAYGGQAGIPKDTTSCSHSTKVPNSGQSKPVPNLSGASGARTRAIRAPYHVRANDPEPQRRGDGPPRPLSKLQRSLKVSARAGASNDPAWACGPWSRPERTGAKRRTLVLGRAPAPVWSIASRLARVGRSGKMPGSAGRFGTD